MRIIKQTAAQPFIAMVALAALIHSTWSVSVMFNGLEPGIVDLGSGLHWLWWVLPGILFAVALDIGQLSAAHSLRLGSKSRMALASKVATFATMAAFSYALQLLYLLHHVPLLSFGDGLSLASQHAAQTVWEVLVWLIPGMLPVSIIMFTATDTLASGRDESQTVITSIAAAGPQPQIESSSSASAHEPSPDVVRESVVNQFAAAVFEMACGYPGCDFVAIKDTEVSAQTALAAHFKRHTRAAAALASQNGTQ